MNSVGWSGISSELCRLSTPQNGSGSAGLEKVKYYLLQMESPVKGEDMKQGELQNTKISENVGVRSFRKLEMSVTRSHFGEHSNGAIRY